MGYPWSSQQELLAADLNAIIATIQAQAVNAQQTANSGGPPPTFGIVATGTTQAGAAPLPGTVNHVATVPPGSGVILSAVMQRQLVYNDGANALLAYPQLGAQIRAFGDNIAVEIVAGGSATFLQVTPGQWSVF